MLLGTGSELGLTSLFGYLGAVNYLPVNLLVLIYFSHPLFVGFLAMVFRHQPVNAASIAALIVAVFGLVLALGLSSVSPDLGAGGLAALAAVAAALVIVGNARAIRKAEAVVVFVYMMLGQSQVQSLG